MTHTLDLDGKIVRNYLLDKTFHVTSLEGALGIFQNNEIRSFDTRNWNRISHPPMSLQINRISLFDFQNNSIQEVKDHIKDCWPWPYAQNLKDQHTRVFFMFDYEKIKDRCINYTQARKLNYENTGENSYNRGLSQIELFCKGPLSLDIVEDVMIHTNFNNRVNSLDHFQEIVRDISHKVYFRALQALLNFPTTDDRWDKEKTHTFLKFLSQ